MTDDPQTTNDKKDDGAGLIHPAIPDVAETQPRPSKELRKAHEDLRMIGEDCQRGALGPNLAERLWDICDNIARTPEWRETAFAGGTSSQCGCGHPIREHEWMRKCRWCSCESPRIGSGTQPLSEASASPIRSESAQDNSRWQSISTAPNVPKGDRHSEPFIGGQYHRIYGWVWGRCRRYSHADDNAGSYIAGDVTPTHWVPLPSPPSEEK